jgi:uncharacterized protein (DUF58 family)
MTDSPSAPERLLQRLDWTVIRRLDGQLQGDYRTLFRGQGIDFADLREYQWGDDVRSIDWNVTARMDTPYVREFIEDREITAWFLLDLSPSVDFGTLESERLKRSVLIDFVTTLARLLTRHGNKVGAVLYGSKVERTIPARGGRIQVLRMVNDLLAQPRLARSPQTDLAPLLDAGQATIKGRALVFVISDFISAPGWERALNVLSRRHEVLAVRLFDRARPSCPTSAHSSWRTPRPASSCTWTRTIGASGSGSRRRPTDARRRSSEAFTRSGVDHVSLSTDEDLVRAIVRMAARRTARKH